MFTHSKKRKTLRQTFAWVLSLAMVFSNLTMVPVQASTVSGGDAAAVSSGDSSGGSSSEASTVISVDCSSIDSGISLINSYISKKINSFPVFKSFLSVCTKTET